MTSEHYSTSKRDNTTVNFAAYNQAAKKNSQQLLMDFFDLSDTFIDLLYSIEFSLKKNGVDDPAISFDCALDVSMRMGGIMLFLPSLKNIKKQARNYCICVDFNGFNHRELARKHRITTRSIRDILKSSNKKAFELNNLLDDDTRKVISKIGGLLE